MTDFVENGEFVSGGVEDGWEITKEFDGLINNCWHDNGKEGNNETDNEDIRESDANVAVFARKKICESFN